MATYKDLDKSYSEIEKFCLGKFQANEDLFKTTIKENIEKYRKGKVTVTLKDKDGNPLSGVKVRAVLKNHEFKHGAHIFMLDQFEDEEKNKEYRKLFPEYFNLATVPFYWKELEPEEGKPRYAADSPNIYRRPSPDLCVDFCRENGIAPKLHCLFYDKFIPDWTPKNDAEKMKSLYEKRFSEIAERYGNGVMYDVEVINELLQTYWWTTHSVISDTKDSLEWSFKLAEKYFPSDVLVINDGTYIPEIGKMTYRHPYYMLIESALLKGARIDKIGIQNHIYMRLAEDDNKYFEPYFDPIMMMKGLDVLSEFGKPLEITEISIPTLGDDGHEAEDVQAEVLRYLYTLWFSSKNVESTIYWNTVCNSAYVSPEWDENRARAGIFNRDLTPKKAALMFKKLFKEEWHTDVELVSDEGGKIELEGYYGDYELHIKSEKENLYNLKLNKNVKGIELCLN